MDKKKQKNMNTLRANTEDYINIKYQSRCRDCAYLSTDDSGYWWCEDWSKRCCEVQYDECEVESEE